jgi:hypothetical protein
MSDKKKKLTVVLDEDLYKQAKLKSDKKLCMPLATLVRVFLKAFVTQKGVGFFVGESELTELINKWVRHRDFERSRDGRVTIHNNKLRDIFDLKA